MHSFIIANLNGNYAHTFICKAEMSTANNLKLYVNYKYMISVLYFCYTQPYDCYFL